MRYPKGRRNLGSPHSYNFDFLDEEWSVSLEQTAEKSRSFCNEAWIAIIKTDITWYDTSATDFL